MKRMQPSAHVGVVEHGNSAVLVTVSSAGEFLDRRRIDLTHELPTHPHHHEGSCAVGRYLNLPGSRRMAMSEAVALVEKVRTAAALGASTHLDMLAASLALPVAGIALRLCPPLPETVEACIADNRAQTVADTVMYRRIMADAARARGWSVHWYDRDRVYRDATAALRGQDAWAVVQTMGKAIGPPWRSMHKLAAAAAVSTTLDGG